MQTKCITSVGSKIVVQLFGICLCLFVGNGKRKGGALGFLYLRERVTHTLTQWAHRLQHNGSGANMRDL